MAFLFHAVHDTTEFASDVEAFLESRQTRTSSNMFPGRIGLWSVQFVVGYEAAASVLCQHGEVSRRRGLGSLPGMSLYGEDAIHISDGVKAQVAREQIRPALSSPANVSAASRVLKASFETTFADVENDAWSRPFEAYEFSKVLAVDLLVAVIFGHEPGSSCARNETSQRVEKESTLFWRAVTSSAIASDRIPAAFRFVKTSYDLGIEAKQSLFSIFDDQPAAPCIARDLMHLSNEDRRQHLLLFTSSLAHKSFSSMITSFLMVVGDAPDIANRLRDEIPCDCDLRDVESFQFLNACLKEVERLYPPVIGLYLVVDSDRMRVGDTDLLRDTKIWCSILSANRDERVYGKNAKEFQPERWLSSGRIPPSLTYGTGPRDCLGQTLVRTLLLQTCAFWISRFEWRIQSSSRKYRWLPVARPRNGLSLELKRRNEEFFDAM